MKENGRQGDRTRPIKGRRPFLLKIILWVYLLWSLLGWLRFAGAWRNQDLILGLVSPGLHLYLVIFGLVSGLVSLPVIWGLITRASWTPLLIHITAALYPALYWFERLFLWENRDAERNWLFMLVLTLLWVGTAYGTLRLQRVQQFFKENRTERS
jgi:hypothetical protein